MGQPAHPRDPCLEAAASVNRAMGSIAQRASGWSSHAQCLRVRATSSFGLQAAGHPSAAATACSAQRPGLAMPLTTATIKHSLNVIVSYLFFIILI